jgi:predicted RNA-binding Zn-ribbon protein involved in translation (DUF1610 family)
MKKKVHIVNDYKTHKYETDYLYEKIYCPKCANRSVYRADDGGDYYVGEQYVCIECGSFFYLPNGVGVSNYDIDTQTITQLREANPSSA